MKRFVSKEDKLAALLTAVLFALMLVFETGKAVLMLLLIAATGIFVELWYDPPRWVRRGPLGRWLRR